MLESEQSLQSYLHTRQVQDESQTVYAHKLTKPEAQIDWSLDAIQIDRNIRAFNPWYVAYIVLDESNNLRVWNSSISSFSNENAQIGEIIAIDKNGVHVACATGAVCLSSLQW